MQTYDQSSWGINPGSPGSYQGSKPVSKKSPGTITLFSRKIILDETSKIIAGYKDWGSKPDILDPDGQPKKPYFDNRNVSGSYSGGSVLIVSRNFELGGEISANGEPSNFANNGEGSGGIVQIVLTCWSWKKLLFNYNFSKTQIQVKQGTRNTQTFLDGKFTDPVPQKFLAEPGKVLSTPCYIGHHGYNCAKCPLGTYKTNPFTDFCYDCENSSETGSHKIFKVFNDCSDFECDSSIISISKDLNKECLLTEKF